MKRLLISSISAICIAVSSFAALAAELIMIDQDGCIYCERWTAEVGPIYSKTDEGKFAPLRRINIRSLPQDLELASKPIFTPTFILMEDGKELGRVEGYSGDEFFWFHINELLKKSPEYMDTGS